MDRSVLSMRWRDAAFAHWPADATALARVLPDGLEVATPDGAAYLGVVPFVMSEIGVPGVPGGRSFPELNLRTYVRRDGERGVYFLSLDAADRLGVGVARALYALPYYRAELRVRRVEDDDDPPAVTVRSRRTHRDAPPARFDATCRATGAPFTPEAGSLAAFLTENYAFYATSGRGSDPVLLRGRIDHEPWTLRPASLDVRSNTLFRAAGLDRPTGDPVVHYSPGAAVTAGVVRPVDAGAPLGSAPERP
jgi:hypothetical protein